MDIHQGRGNALRILGGVLQSALDRLSIEIAEINGGSAQNAIPREASAVVVLDAAREKELKSLAATAESGREVGPRRLRSRAPNHGRES